jgi:PST family polysaccharide transporter
MSVIERNEAVLRKAARGHRSMLFAQGLKITCKLVSVLVLARLVSPNDHGLFAMASSVVLLLALFRDAGLGPAAVQADALDETQLNTLFWCHLGLGVGLALLTVGIAKFAAEFYANPAVTPLLVWMSGAFLLIGAGGFARTQLERAARFQEVSWLEGTAAIVGTVVMIAAAMAGAGAYSFVAYLMVSEAVATLLAWRALPWRPHAAPQWSSVRELLVVGRNITSYHVLVHLGQQIDGIVVGRFFGAHTLGLYNRANQLLTLPQVHIAAPLNQVSMTTLSRLGVHSIDFVQHARATAIAVLHLVLPLFAVCVVLPDETVRLVLGAQWPEAAPLLRLLAISAAAITVTSLGYAISVAAGQTRRLVQSAAFALPLTLFAVWLGTKHGPLGVAASVAIVNAALVLPRLWWALRRTSTDLPAYIGAMVGPILTAAGFSAGLMSGLLLVRETAWPVRFGVSVCGGLVALAFLSLLWPRLRDEWRLVASYLPFPWRRE